MERFEQREKRVIEGDKGVKDSHFGFLKALTLLGLDFFGLSKEVFVFSHFGKDRQKKVLCLPKLSDRIKVRLIFNFRI